MTTGTARTEILLLAQDPDLRKVVDQAVADDDTCGIHLAGSLRHAKSILSEETIDLVIADASASAGAGTTFLSDLRVSHPDIIRVLVLDKLSPKRTSDVVDKTAAYQVLAQPIVPAQVDLLVRRAMETRELARRHRWLSRELKFSEEALSREAHLGSRNYERSHHFDKLVYADPRMAELCRLAKQAAPTNLPILIEGETGTGKELLARAIHYHSKRRESPLMVQNCGGLPDELLRSELFGHQRGAFTGAVSDRLGLFRAADGGTVFLDELSAVSPSFQVSLLRFLQEGEVKPLGSDETLMCDVRILAATNQPLKKLVAAGKFREDLYFRLKGIDLELPPLRERRDDIRVLSEFLAQKHAAVMNRRILGITRTALDKLEAYDYPGNVRELEAEIRRMVALSEDGMFLSEDLLSPNFAAIEPHIAPESPILDGGGTLKERVESLETRLVSEALSRHQWNQSRAAQELGLSRVGLANKIKRYGIAPRSTVSSGK